MVYPGPMPAYLYGRASVDPSKKGRSVSSQLTEGRALCAEHDWPIAGEFQDIDRSASRYARRARDDFEAMIEGVQSGKCRILVAFEASRYYRDIEVYIRLRNACAENGVLLCYNGTVYDLSKREDRKITAQDALNAEDEADGIRERNLRTMRQNAAKGRPHGRLLYGYARRYDQDTGELIEQYPHPERAPIVAEIFERIAAGETEYSVVQDLRKRGPRLPGIEWQQYHLVDMLRNRSYMGRRIHQGKDIREGTWKPLVDEETFNAVQQIINDPARLTTKDWSVKHLLSGIARCGECPDEPHLRVVKNRGYLSYMCDAKFDTNMREEKLDAYVEEAVITWLGSKAAVAAFRSGDEEKRAAAARLRLEQLTKQLEEARAAAGRFSQDGTPELSIASLGALEGSLAPLIEKARRQAEEVSAPPMLRSLVGQPDMEERWQDLTIEQRRMVLRLVVNIRLHKARSRGVRTIEPGRISLTFVGQPGFRSASRRVPASAPALGDGPGVGPGTGR